jgi:hypothetical protein
MLFDSSQERALRETIGAQEFESTTSGCYYNCYYICIIHLSVSSAGTIFSLFSVCSKAYCSLGISSFGEHFSLFQVIV